MDEQPENAHFPRRLSFDPASNVRWQRFQHSMKQQAEIISSEEGRQIDCSDTQKRNAPSPRIETREAASNVNSES
jgi:hypothetical protein